jgi:peptidoglycan/LPS O-acetylase OafA/YrhL
LRCRWSTLSLALPRWWERVGEGASCPSDALRNDIAQSGNSDRTAHAPSRLAPINGLRGIAILAVVYFHVVCGMWPSDRVPVWLSPLVSNGWTGVNLFFMLSGFVLFLPYADGQRTMQGLSDRLSFYRRRFLRLMPLFYVAVIVEWLPAAAQGHAGASDLFSVLGLAFVLDAKGFAPSFNPALWSIGVEIAFSALFPLLAELASRRGMARLVAAVLALALAARLLGIHRYPALQGATFNSDMFLCRLDEFVLGMLLAQLYAAGRTPRRIGGCVLGGLALVGLAWIGFDSVLRGVMPPLGRAVLNDVLDAGLFLIVLAALVPGTRFAAALAWRPLQVLGMMCYSLYIWHGPLLDGLLPARAALPAPAFLAALLLFALLTFAVGALSYRFIEFGSVAAWRPLFLLAPSAGSQRSMQKDAA